MTGVEQATEIVLGHGQVIDPNHVALDSALGKVLREQIFADRDFPPFDRVAMDGIAIRFGDYTAGMRTFQVVGSVAAGAAPLPLWGPGNCMEVATGAVLPEGADTVIQYEHLDANAGMMRLHDQPVNLGQHIHRKGFDRRENDVLLEPGTRIGPAEISVLATVGKTSILVSRQLRVAVLSTGDELVPVTATPLPWQIRLSNSYAIQALLASLPVNVDTFLCEDIFEGVEKTVAEILTEYDALLVTGGVSAGKRDFIPLLLQQLGVEILFHKVTQRPGKPLLFGRNGSGAAVFALPGNPVSAFMCTCRYVIPWLEKKLGLGQSPAQWAFLDTPLEFKPNLTWFVPVLIENQFGKLLAKPKPGHGSGDLANLQDADGFLELPKGSDWFDTETPFRLYRYR